MIKELLINKTKELLKQKIKETQDKYLSQFNLEEKQELKKIINKEIYTRDDINDLLIDYFPKELNDYEILCLLKPNSKFRKKLSNKEEILIYIISHYLITQEKYQISIIEIINNIKIYDINILDEYLNNESKDNDLALSLINKLSTNDILKSLSRELSQIFNLFNNKLINVELINNFIEDEKITKYNNYYYQYQEINKKLQEPTNNKNLILTYFTFNNNLELFTNIKLTKEDLINYLKELEEKEIILNNNQLNNLLDNFRKKYLKDESKEKEINILKNKVIKEFSKYYDEHFYFKIEDFINYYNNNNQDDFSSITFSKEKKELTRNIFDSFFASKDVNETVIALEEELKNFKNTKIQIANYKINSLEIDKIYYERCKFYLIYIDKVKEYYKYKDDITIDYFILKNIPDQDQASFYELSKYYYGPSLKQIAKNSKTIKNSIELLKQEFLEELSSTDFEKRYELLNKYKNYCNKLRCLSLFNETHLLKILEEYELKYFNISTLKKTKKKNNKN